jgi:putative phosphoribosyl transferase
VAPRARTRSAAKQQAAQLAANPASRPEVPAANRVSRGVDIDAGGLELPGILTIPPQATGVVAFAQGSGSSRLRPPDRAVARALNMAGIATLLFYLLTIPEEADQRNIFDIALLTRRLVAATRWLQGQPATAELALGYTGASTGAAAALNAAAELGTEINAIVLRGGRTDLAESRLPEVAAPTLMIVGGNDREVLEHNRRAQSMLRCPSDLAVVPGATHFFEEPGALNQMTDLAIAWFHRHLRVLPGLSRP